MRGLERELRRELAPEHRLHGARVSAAARCEGCDDVLFSVADRSFPWAVVHLTWTGREERSPWPTTTPLAGLAELLVQWADHDCTGDQRPVFASEQQPDQDLSLEIAEHRVLETDCPYL